MNKKKLKRLRKKNRKFYVEIVIKSIRDFSMGYHQHRHYGDKTINYPNRDILLKDKRVGRFRMGSISFRSQHDQTIPPTSCRMKRITDNHPFEKLLFS